jgi:hypothetical protein
MLRHIIAVFRHHAKANCAGAQDLRPDRSAALFIKAQKVFDFFVCWFTMLKQDVPQREQLGRSPTKAFPPDVRFGSLADICTAIGHVRLSCLLWAKSGL